MSTPADEREWAGQWDEEAPPKVESTPRLLNRLPRDRWRRTLVELVVLLLVAWGLTHDWSPDTRSASTFHEIRYELDGTADSASITISTPGGGTRQEDVSVPLKTTGGGQGLTLRYREGEFVYFSAQITGSTQAGTATITCRVFLDNVLVQSNTSTGSYSIVSCTGRV